MIKKLLRLITRQAKYETGYVDGFNAAEETMVPRAHADAHAGACPPRCLYKAP